MRFCDVIILREIIIANIIEPGLIMVIKKAAIEPPF